jgi:hypothetical protein
VSSSLCMCRDHVWIDRGAHAVRVVLDLQLLSHWDRVPNRVALAMGQRWLAQRLQVCGTWRSSLRDWCHRLRRERSRPHGGYCFFLFQTFVLRSAALFRFHRRFQPSCITMGMDHRTDFCACQRIRQVDLDDSVVANYP